MSSAPHRCLEESLSNAVVFLHHSSALKSPLIGRLPSLSLDRSCPRSPQPPARRSLCPLLTSPNADLKNRHPATAEPPEQFCCSVTLVLSARQSFLRRPCCPPGRAPINYTKYIPYTLIKRHAVLFTFRRKSRP